MFNAACDAALVVVALVLILRTPSALYDFLQNVSALTSTLAIVLLAVFRLLKYFRSNDDRSEFEGPSPGSHDVYSLDHGRLNLDAPPATMWMNMGYWKNTLNFATACHALLIEVLKAAELVEMTGGVTRSIPGRRLNVVDLGFGCGDQTLALHDNLQIEHYTGMTLNSTQFQFAKARLRSVGVLGSDMSAPVQIFCTDAAKPESWSGQIVESIWRGVEDPTAKAVSVVELWVLALDTLYHFSPSRLPVFEYACRRLHASLMAFDLVLADEASLLNRLLLRLTCLVSGTPYSNFVTTTEYRKMLVSAGYTVDNIKIVDISEHVFLPLADSMKRRQAELNSIGLSMGMFRGAKAIFRWWGTSGVVRGVIVVAARGPES